MSKYNTGFPLNISDLSEEEKLKAYKEFAEGSEILEECLIEANKLGLKTNSCCRGYHEIKNVPLFMLNFFDGKLDALALSQCWCQPYISFVRESEVFSYLSEALINNPNVELDESEYSRAIYFNGDTFPELMKNFIQDIKSGKKDNQLALMYKVNKRNSPEYYYNAYVYASKRSGFSEEDIDLLKMIMALNALRRSHGATRKEFYSFCIKIGLTERQTDLLLDNAERVGIKISSSQTK